MEIVVLEGIINHNRETYTQGETISGVSKEEAERLVNLGVAKIISEKSEKEIKTPSRSKTKKDTEKSEA